MLHAPTLMKRQTYGFSVQMVTLQQDSIMKLIRYYVQQLIFLNLLFSIWLY